MPQEFDGRLNAHLTRDASGAVRDLLHLDAPYVATANAPLPAAREYLERYADGLGIERSQLDSLELQPTEEPIDVGVEYRLAEMRRQFDATAVVFSQTALGLPVWNAGIVVSLLDRPLRVVSSQSTDHREIEVSKPSAQALRKLTRLDEKTLAPKLGLRQAGAEFVPNSLQIQRRRLLVYRYDPATRTLSPAPTSPPAGDREHDAHPFHTPVILPLPPVDDGIVDGGHYVAAELILILGTRTVPDLHWVAIVEARTLDVLYLRPLADSVDGLVFHDEPITDYGGPAASASNAALNAARVSVQLEGLDPPAGGTYLLTGDNVALVDVEPPAVAAPTEPAGTDFNFSARTNDFAAVNTYYHADRFFRLVADLGFDVASYFGGTLFPTTVDHRGLGGWDGIPLNGDTINAHCLGNGSFGIQQTTFALADLTNVAQPLGIACDYRVVLHELGGHGTLYNYVNGPNFHFSHSAGDSFGAVLCDPESKAPDRFESFPFVPVVNRRHDRTPALGWGWNGNIALNPFNPVIDNGGYNNEQILSTTHFRIYRSLGGDSTEVDQRHYAARYVAYLILRAIATITQATSPPTALGWATALMTVDAGDWTHAGQIGGVYAKVIRWAFELQGMYQPAATPKPNNNIGPPPPVDVYIDDGRAGQYEFAPGGTYPSVQRFWETTKIWNRHRPDGHADHQPPIVGEPNYAYLAVHNRGTQAATGVWVRGDQAAPRGGLVWPDDFKPTITESISIAGPIAPGAHVQVGPLEWRPQHEDDVLLMSSGATGDRANNDPTTLLPCAAGPTPLWRLVPCDNNIALRAVFPVPGGGGTHALLHAFEHRWFTAANPFAATAKVQIQAELPSFLATRGWTLTLDNPGGGSFSLGPRDTREIRPRLQPGHDFTAADVAAAGTVAITFLVVVDGISVGGLTYVLDANMKHSTSGPHDDPDHAQPGHHHHEPDHVRRLKIEVDLD